MMLRHVLLIGFAFAVSACGAKQPAKETKAPETEAKKQPAATTPPPPPPMLIAGQAMADDDAEPAPPPAQQIMSPKRKNWAARYEAPFLAIDPKGHTGKIKDAIFTRWGYYLVTAGYDKTVRVWRTYNGELKRTIRGQVGPGANGRIYAAALSPGDSWLALATRDGDRHVIRFLNFHNEETLSVLSGHRDVISSLDFSPDKRYLISGSYDHTARIWDAYSRTYRRTLRGHSDKVLSVAISGDSRTAATAGADGTVMLWDTSSGRQLSTLTGHEGPVRSVAFTPDSRYVISGGDDHTLRLFEAPSGRFVRVLATQEASVASLSISPDGTKVVTGCSRGKTVNNVYAIPSGRLISSFDRHDNIVLATAFSSDSRTVATAGGNDHEIYLWDADTGNLKRKISSAGETVWSVGFSRDGSSIAWGKTFNQAGVERYQLNGGLDQSFNLRNNNGYDLYRSRTLYSDDNYLRAQETVGDITVRTKDGRIHPALQIVKGGTVTHEIVRNAWSGRDHRCFTLTPDGRTVISGGANGELSGYNTSTGALTSEFIGHEGDVLAVAVSPDGSTLVSGSADQTVRLWDVSSGRLLLTIFETTGGQWVAWTEEGYYTSSAYGDSFVGWQINRGIDKQPQYFAASALSPMFRYPSVVGYYLDNRGRIQDALRLANQHHTIKYYALRDVVDLAPPYVAFTEPTVRYSRITGDRIRIHAKAISTNGLPVKDMWILVNGRRVNRYWGAEPKISHHGTTAEIELDLYLHEAYNRISVVAQNELAISEPVSIEVRKTEEEITPYNQMAYKPNLYMLSIGISDHRDADFALRYAHKDAEAVADLMKKQSKLFSNVYTRVITNRSATRSTILSNLEWLSKQATQKDVALIFLSGHGLKDDLGEYYFFPYDGVEGSLARTAVKWQDFKNVLENLPSKVILMADTCHSGDITGSRLGKGRKKDMTQALRDLAVAGSGVVVLTASTGRERSWEDDKWGHGAFTKALVDGLKKKADYNKDKVIYLKELDLYITERVKKLTDGQQHPTTEIPQTMPDFPLAFL